jgi:1,4-dihydroxy-2-naphthoyl-CoA hydrolase
VCWLFCCWLLNRYRLNTTQISDQRQIIKDNLLKTQAAPMTFKYSRVIRFHETDAAGVVYFANLLTLCHEAYEASLQAAGIDLKSFFSGQSALAVPIVHAEANFYQPLFCGDAIAILLTPKALSPHSFEVNYRIVAESAIEQALENNEPESTQPKPLAQALTRHVCINGQNRSRQALTPKLADWLNAWS